jgi:Na+-driven multidrug efflux pump
MAVCGIVIASVKDVLGLLFISDTAVVSAIASIAPLAAIFQLVDGIMGTTSGALRGMGRQKELLIYNFTGERCNYWHNMHCLHLTLTLTIDTSAATVAA